MDFSPFSPVVIICMDDSLIRRFMLRAHSKGMTNGDYAYFSPSLLPTENIRSLWKDENDAKNDAKAYEAYRSLLRVSIL